MPLPSSPKLEEIYEIHRHYVQHEDDLVNQRTTWLITLQSFLVATFGFSYQKRFEIIERLVSAGKSLKDLGTAADEYNVFLVLLATIGLVVSLVAFLSVRAASLSLQAIDKNWRSMPGQSNAHYLPSLLGGGDPTAVKHGLGLSIAIPAFFFVLWAFAFLFLLYKFTPR